MTRVVVIDDEALVCSGFRLILSAAPDIDVVATGTGASAVQIIEQHRPDVVLLDIRMPVKDGLSVLAELRSGPSRAAIAMLTTFDADEHLQAALRLGASGFLLKDTDPEQLPHMVRNLAAGGLVFSDTVGSRVIDGYLRDGPAAPASKAVATLSERETQVLQLLARGASNAHIAGVLYISMGTVKDQVSSILSKLDVRTRVEAAVIAARAGILAGDP